MIMSVVYMQHVLVTATHMNSELSIDGIDGTPVLLLFSINVIVGDSYQHSSHC